MKKFFVSVLFLILFTSAYAQSSEVITEILNAKQVTFGQVCYLAAVQQEIIGEDASYTDAIDAMYKRGYIPNIIYEDTVVPMVNLAYIYSHMWYIKGGLMYKLFKGAPRYAFKQLKADGVIPANTDPGKIVSGMEALNIYTSCSIEYGRMKIYVD